MQTRFNGNVVPFADDATSTNRTVFGGTTQSDDIDDNLNADFKKGWEIVGLNDNPTREDFNAMGYTLGALTAYLYEMGISEWNASQNYRVNSRVVGSDGKVYKALTGTIGTPNTGNDPISDAINWENEYSNFVDLVNDQIINGIKTFGNFPITPSSAPTTNYQVSNKKYVDDTNVFVANDSRVKTALNASGTPPIYASRAWVNFNGTGTVAIRGAGNFSSITDFGTGDYKANFTTAMPDTNYGIATAWNRTTFHADTSHIYMPIANITTDGIRLNTYADLTTLGDFNMVNLVIYK